jgi:hypothetical protein
MAGGNVFLWWQIDPDEIEDHARDYHVLNIFRSARGIAALCLLFSVAVTCGFVWFRLQGYDSGALIDVGVMTILAFYVWRGHRWAMLAAMLFWTAEKGFGVFNAFYGSKIPVVSVLMQVVWWGIFMHFFYRAYRVERRHRRMLRESGNGRTVGQALLHGLGTIVLLVLLLVVMAVATGGYLFAATEYYSYAELNSGGRKLIIGSSHNRFMGNDSGLVIIGDGDNVVTYTLARDEWDRLFGFWNVAMQAKPGPLHLEGKMLERDTWDTELSIYSGNGVRLVLKTSDQCVRYDIAAADLSTVDASIRNVRQDFNGQGTGKRMQVGVWGGLKDAVRSSMPRVLPSAPSEKQGC